MLQELSIPPATVVIVAVMAVLMFLAIRRMAHKGLCDCGEKCSDCNKCSEAAGCKDPKKNVCTAAARIVESMDASLE